MSIYQKVLECDRERSYYLDMNTATIKATSNRIRFSFPSTLTIDEVRGRACELLGLPLPATDNGVELCVNLHDVLSVWTADGLVHIAGHSACPARNDDARALARRLAAAWGR